MIKNNKTNTGKGETKRPFRRVAPPNQKKHQTETKIRLENYKNEDEIRFHNYRLM